jgi:acyl-CoA thioesterase
MPVSNLDQVLASLVQEGEDYLIEAPEAWSQGRTLYGGMTAALSYSAVRRACGDLPPLRTAQFSFIGPATGQLRFRPVLLRRGRSAGIAAADCRNEDGITARAMFVFGEARASEVAHDFTPRLDVPPPEQCEPFHRTSKPLQGFLARFEFRFAAGARLFEREKRPEFAVWTRFRDGATADPVASLFALADALPCAAMANFPRPAPLSTMTWSVDIHRPPTAQDDWRLLWSSSEDAAEGYSIQNMRVYDRAGEPLASGRQLVAIFA